MLRSLPVLAALALAGVVLSLLGTLGAVEMAMAIEGVPLAVAAAGAFAPGLAEVAAVEVPESQAASPSVAAKRSVTFNILDI